MTALLIIFAKEPRPGQVKTRLSPPLSPEEAAQLYHSFLLDILEEMARVPEMRLAVGFSPLKAQGFFRGLAPPGTDLFPQEGADLGERMARAIARGFAADFGPVVLRGSDIPDLPAAVVSEAREVLAAGQAQVVLGPCPDGGYYLVGLTEPQPPLFQGPAWSSRTVLADTLRLARQLGLRVHLLPPWPDIDTYDNLRTFLHRTRPAPQPGWRSRETARKLLGRLSAGQPQPG
ncbi:MAG: glycosyltransferase [Deltaproteobacteria bacterium]|nr:glycosyltransferase [Deltaproteobacteria bacterium]